MENTTITQSQNTELIKSGSVSNSLLGNDDSLGLISIAEARKVMGDEAREMSDKDIENAIYDLTGLARAYIKSVPLL